MSEILFVGQEDDRQMLEGFDRPITFLNILAHTAETLPQAVLTALAADQKIRLVLSGYKTRRGIWPSPDDWVYGLLVASAVSETHAFFLFTNHPAAQDSGLPLIDKARIDRSDMIKLLATTLGPG